MNGKTSHTLSRTDENDKEIGLRFGLLTVVRRVTRTTKGNARWELRCDCGSLVIRVCSSVRYHADRNQSCGCTKVTHGLARTPEYRAWTSMKDRCTNSNNREYHRYGGRGIRVCDEWDRSFESFVGYLGSRPSGHSLDRINNDGNYEPGNVRWATKAQQVRNRSTSRFITFQGETLNISEWAARFCLPCGTLRTRLRLGWDIGLALTKPATKAGAK